jgi:hypothetical protein
MTALPLVTKRRRVDQQVCLCDRQALCGPCIGDHVPVRVNDAAVTKNRRVSDGAYLD